jgi:hypothetical protein
VDEKRAFPSCVDAELENPLAEREHPIPDDWSRQAAQRGSADLLFNEYIHCSRSSS